MSRFRKFTPAAIVLLFLVGVYSLATFTSFPLLSDVRIIWIETAMTTSGYRWMATKFFPRFVVDEVISNRVMQTDAKNNPDLIRIRRDSIVKDVFLVTEPSPNEYINERALEDEELNQKIKELGHTLLIDDKEQEIKLVQVKTATYSGHLLLIADPSRIVVQDTWTKNERGQLLKDLCNAADGIAAINGNGFEDENGMGTGEKILGWSVSGGKEWGLGSKSKQTSIGFDAFDRLVVGNLTDFAKQGIRDLVQFQPAMIIDGEQLVKGSAGWGVQPRTVVGQTESGMVIFAVIDGRKLGHSLGITIGDLAEILLDYGVINAGACDGGGSSMLYYNGTVYGLNSSNTPEVGRYIPNAIVVKKKNP